MNLQTGAFGNPQEFRTLILFWAKMEELHYPGAAATKKYLEERMEEEQMQQQQALSGMPEGAAPPGVMPQGPPGTGGMPGMPADYIPEVDTGGGLELPPQVMEGIARMAQEQARRDVGV